MRFGSKVMRNFCLCIAKRLRFKCKFEQNLCV